MDEDWKGSFDKKHFDLKSRKKVTFNDTNQSEEDVFKELEEESLKLEKNNTIIEKKALKPLLIIPGHLFLVGGIILGSVLFLIFLRKLQVI